MESQKVLWDAHTTWELAELVRQDPVVILPVGALEQHGPHLPLDTDTHIVGELAKAAASRAGCPCFLLPPVWFGLSEHHMGFCGTLTVRPSTLLEVVFDLLRSLKRHGVNKVLLLNGHGGNMAVLRSAVDRAGAELGLRAVLATYWHLVGEEIAAWRLSPRGGMSHGCELETSLKFYLRPEDVRQEKMKPNIVPGNDFWSPDMFAANKVAIFRAYKELSPEGHIGDPTKASAGLGEKVFETAVEKLVDIVALMHRGEL